MIFVSFLPCAEIGRCFQCLLGFHLLAKCVGILAFIAVFNSYDIICYRHQLCSSTEIVNMRWVQSSSSDRFIGYCGQLNICSIS